MKAAQKKVHFFKQRKKEAQKKVHFFLQRKKEAQNPEAQNQQIIALHLLIGSMWVCIYI